MITMRKSRQRSHFNLDAGGKSVIRTGRVLLLLTFVVGLAILNAGPGPQAAAPAGVGPLAQSRLVVFETFMRPG